MDAEVVRAARPFVESGATLALEFFLNAAGIGAFLAGVGATFAADRDDARSLPATGLLVGLVLVMVAPGILLLHLGQPARVWHLWYYLNPRSPITWGTILLTLFPVGALGTLAAILAGRGSLARWFGVVTLPVALATQGYTAFVLTSTSGRLLWASPVLIPLFLVSSMAGGAGLLHLVAVARGGRSRAGAMALVPIVRLGLVLVLVFLGLYLFHAWQWGLAGRLLAEPLWLAAMISTAVPAATLLVPSVARSGPSAGVACALALVSLAAIRFAVVLIGEAIHHGALTSGVPGGV